MPKGTIYKMCSQSTARKSSGSLVVELGMTFVSLLVFVILAVDIGVILYGAFLNDRACRTAVRAAAQGKDSTEATRLAKRTILTIVTPGSWIKSPELQLPIVYEDFGGNFSPDVSPFVTITTRTEVELPAPIFFAGNSFMPSGKTDFKQTYTFPIVKVK